MGVSDLRKAVALAAAALVAGGLGLGAPGGTAVAADRWAPVDRATITPGVQMLTKGSQCTGNFVFTDRRERVYVGYSAHCAEVVGPVAAPVGAPSTGCNTPSHPLGTRVRFESGGSLVTVGERVGSGRLAYSSWATMQRIGTTDAVTCEYNDFALVRVSRADLGKVNPSVPFWGGPVGLRTSGLSFGEEVFSYGSSSLRAGLTPTSPKTGTSTGDVAGGWSHNVYTVTPGVFGDSGSGFLDARGRAFGTLSTIATAPPGENGVADLSLELAFARQHSGIPGLRLVTGTEPFVGLG